MSAFKTVCGDDELMFCLEAAHYQCMQKYLLQSGMGDWTAKDEKALRSSLRLTMEGTGETLLFALLRRISDVRLQARFVQVFAHEDVDVNTRDECGRTPLMICLERGLDKSAKHLIQAESLDHFLADANGNTALHYGAIFGRTDVLRAYLKVIRLQVARQLNVQSGVKYAIHQDIFTIRNRMGDTILDSAINADHDDTARLIVKEKSIHSILVNKKLGSFSKPLKRNVSFDSVHRCSDDQNTEILGASAVNVSASSKESPLSLRKLWRRWRSPPPSPRPRVASAITRTEFFKSKEKSARHLTPSSDKPSTPLTPDCEQSFSSITMRRRSVSESGIRPLIRVGSTDAARSNRILRDPNGLLKKNNCLPPLRLRLQTK